MARSITCLTVFLLICTVGFADVITSVAASWILISASVGANTGTFALPADIPGCGSENEPTCEPTGDFLNSAAFAASGYYTILDAPTGGISDYIVFGNTGPGGVGEILFYSDPNLSPTLTGLTNRGSLCIEDPETGCFGGFNLVSTAGTTFTIRAASDGEGVFDPFGFGIDAGDQIQFTGVTTVVGTPEPSNVLMLASGCLLILLVVLRRKSRPVRY
jgi:hypothetical protein